MDIKHQNRILEILNEFPLKDNVDIGDESKISDIIAIYSSLISERIKSKLIDNFPTIDFSNIKENTTLKEIYELINLNIREKPEIEVDFNKEIDKTNNLISNRFSISEIGIDIENLSFFPKNIFSINQSTFRSRLFSDSEITYSLTRPNPKLTMLGIFCAKEAVQKVLNLKFKNIYSYIQIRHEKEGKPYVLVDNSQSKNLDISISHSKDLAIAICTYKK